MTDWAIAGVAVVSRHGDPLFLRVFTSPLEVRQVPEASACAAHFVSMDDVLDIHFLIHSSLDLCEGCGISTPNVPSANPGDASVAGSPMAVPTSPQSKGAVRSAGAVADPRFLGKLIEASRFTSYGFRSASGICVVFVTVGSAPTDALAPLCRSVYEAASVAICNPFRPIREGPGSATAGAAGIACDSPSLATSKAFTRQVEDVLASFSVTTRSRITT